MTFKEYSLRMEAYFLSEVDYQQDLHYHAWLVARELPATNKKGDKYVYTEFKQVFDKSKILDDYYKQAEKQSEKDERLERLLRIKKNQEEYRRKGGS